MYNEKPRRPRVIYPPRENRKSDKYVLLTYFRNSEGKKKNVELGLSGMERGCLFREDFFLLSPDISFFFLSSCHRGKFTNDSSKIPTFLHSKSSYDCINVTIKNLFA